MRSRRGRTIRTFLQTLRYETIRAVGPPAGTRMVHAICAETSRTAECFATFAVVNEARSGAGTSPCTIRAVRMIQLQRALEEVSNEVGGGARWGSGCDVRMA